MIFEEGCYARYYITTYSFNTLRILRFFVTR